MSSPAQLPNMSVFNQGINLISFDPLSPADGLCNPVFALTATKEVQVGTQTWLCAEQLLVTPLPVASLNGQSQEVTSSYDLQSALSASVSASGMIEEFSFSASVSMKLYQDSSGESQSSMALATGYVACWRLDLDPDKAAPLSDDFRADVKALPASYNQDAYFGFIERYGTSYATSLTFGGRFSNSYSMTLLQRASLFQSDVSVSAEAGVALLASVKVSVDTSSSSFKSFQSQSTASQVIWVGGTPGGSFADWAPTVVDSPTIVGMAVADLSGLLSQANFSNDPDIQAKQSNLATAIVAWANANGIDPSAAAIVTGDSVRLVNLGFYQSQAQQEMLSSQIVERRIGKSQFPTCSLQPSSAPSTAWTVEEQGKASGAVVSLGDQVALFQGSSCLVSMAPSSVTLGAPESIGLYTVSKATTEATQWAAEGEGKVAVTSASPPASSAPRPLMPGTFVTLQHTLDNLYLGADSGGADVPYVDLTRTTPDVNAIWQVISA